MWSNYKIPAGWLIEKCGFKGIKQKKVSVYEKQALVIINLGDAKGIDIYTFSQKIKETVREKFDILLEEEVNIIWYGNLYNNYIVSSPSICWNICQNNL